MKKLSAYLFLFFFLSVGLLGFAQSDSLSQLRLLSNACNVYRHLPVRLLVSVENKSNVVESKNDTAQMLIRCSIDTGNSYMSSGATEQLANDSLVLLITQNTKRMVLYRHKGEVGRRLQAFIGAFGNDSLIQKTFDKYRIGFSALGDTVTAVLASRTKVKRTDMAKDSIVIRYSQAGQQLTDISKINRNLLRLDKQEYENLKGNSNYSNALISIGDSVFYLVRIKQSVYRYLGVWHDGKDMPSITPDRIAADLWGNFKPAASYSDYILTKGN